MMRVLELVLLLYFTVFVFNISFTMNSLRVGTLNVNRAREAMKRALVFGRKEKM